MEVAEAFLNDIGGVVLHYAVFLAAVGTIVMALLEVIKNVFHWRLSFNRRQFNLWLKQDASLRTEFLALTTGGYETEGALFDQPVDKMLGQVQSAANMALDFPEQYPRLYEFLTEIPGSATSAADRATWRAFAVQSPSQAASVGKDSQNEAAKARARIGNLVARKLDAFQNETQYKWSDFNQRVAVTAGSLLIGFTLAVQGFSQAGGWNWPLLVVLSLVGGTVAPFAKDVVTSLSQFGKK